MLEKLHHRISKALIQTSSLEDLSVSVGAIPAIIMKEQRNVKFSSTITIIDQILGVNPESVTPVYPSKYKMTVQLGKLKVENEIIGVVVFQRFEDCRGCVKRSGCDALETGSLLIKDVMYTGYTNQDVAYQESMGLLTGNCTYKFQRHQPRQTPLHLFNMLLQRDVLPVQDAIHNQPETWENFPHSVHERLSRKALQKLMLFSKMQQVNSAVVCARFIIDAYSALHAKKDTHTVRT